MGTTQREELFKKIWQSTHADYQYKFNDGCLAILVSGKKGGAELATVEDFNDDELLSRLKK